MRGAALAKLKKNAMALEDLELGCKVCQFTMYLSLWVRHMTLVVHLFVAGAIVRQFVFEGMCKLRFGK